MTDKAEYLASTDDADVVVRLSQAREQLKDCLLRGLVPIGYWQVQIHDDALALIKSQAAEIKTLKEQLRIERNKTEFWKYPGGRCHICGLKHGGLQCPNLTPMSSGDTP